jgi:Reverse transcriptase (RNA-dependent DNA polymerase)
MIHKRMKVSAGVPQDSIMGALLWNTMYDVVLRLKLPEGVEIVGFADDIVVMGASKKQVEVRTTRAIGTVVNWMSDNKLKVAHNKTEMVVVSNLKQAQTAQVEFDGCLTTSKRQVKYLGVMTDSTSTATLATYAKRRPRQPLRGSCLTEAVQKAVLEG